MSSLPQATVAVVTRTKNRPVLLRRALQSILSQTYEDFVVVVVNDAGERGPVEECVAEVADRAQGRIHVVHNEKSNGREAAMNTGLHNSSSAYVVIHDDDDTWAPDFLAKTTAYLDTHEDGAVAVRTAVVYEKVDGDTITVDRQVVLATDKSDVTLFDMIRRNFTPPISLLYRRAVHDAVGEYAEELPVLADWDFNLRMLMKFEVGFIDGEPLAFWHHRESSTGELGNSVIANADEHSNFDHLIRNRYLREELAEHKMLGTLLYLTELIDRSERSAVGSASVLGSQISKLSDIFDSRMHEANEKYADAIGKINQTNLQLIEVNRNLVSQSNRLVAQLEHVTKRVNDLEALVHSQTPRERLKSWKSLARRKGEPVLRRLR